MPFSAKELNRLKKIKESNEKWSKDELYKPGNNSKNSKWMITKNKFKRGEIEKRINFID